MGQWDISDDARSLDHVSHRSQSALDTTHHEHDLRITALRDRVSSRS
jgi:hypothetical protein